MSTYKIAVVTGSNKGIGYAIVKGLCEKYKGKVYLTSPDVDMGHEAVATLKKLGLNPSYHQLDINDPASVEKFKEYIVKNYGGFDVLINNAGIMYTENAKESFGVQAELTVRTNYFGTLRVSEALVPLLRQNGRLINVSSSVGHLSFVPSKELKDKFSDPNLTIPKLTDLMNEFVRAAKEDPNAHNIWGKYTYFISKVGVCALTRVQQRMLDNETPCRNISANSCHPGYVNTDMTNHKGHLTIEESAVSSLYLALEDHNLKGEFVWRDCTVIDWLAPKLDSMY